jgi:hypothetical protein
VAALPAAARLCKAPPHRQEAGVDQFSFFFAFYGLILGLAVTELLGGFARLARLGLIRRLDPQTALLALFTFLAICATWIDAWDTLKSTPLNFEGLAAPILTATFYYLAASVVFPRDEAELADLGAYYGRRKSFVLAMLACAEVAVSFTFLDAYVRDFIQRPAVFWLFHVPFKTILLGLYLAIGLTKGRRANTALLTALILVLTLPYWTHGAVSGWIHASFDR